MENHKKPFIGFIFDTETIGRVTIAKDYSNVERRVMAQLFERTHQLRKQKAFSKKKRKARHYKQMLSKNKRKVHKAAGSFKKSVYR